MSRFAKFLLVPLVASLLGGCNAVVMAPAGDVAMQQRDLIIIATVLMLLIIIPVMVLVVVFARKYRQGNTDAKYEPNWDHSTHLELVIWAAPLAIIICLGAVTWVSTHLLDPYRQLSRIGPDRLVPEGVEQLEVEVVALDWKWMFIYPQYDIATVNELVVPVDRPISFKLTASTVMNSFYIPAMAGMIYAMPGMQTRLHGVINVPGEYKGIAAHYSGHGFSGMQFATKGVSDAEFDTWVADVRNSPDMLNRQRYLEVEKPSEHVPVMHFAGVESGLYTAIVNMCVERDKMCMSEMMSIDERGGLGHAGLNNLAPELYGGGERNRSPFGPQKTYVAAICSTDEAIAMTAKLPAIAAPSTAPLLGRGLDRREAVAQSNAPALEWLAGKLASTETIPADAL
ncbi:cytochrome o ubiquinol oxidase subunit 2 [Devosia crocina]|uniref:Ubiquinol oxidase polypeptide II n=1 Tax=Devosia crocina TaxID=429728 RepID=A0A1I7N220_9HYPH|nr:ubiquinol oxidase subunit II [Devosia crocina]SFV28606.1 cytochrome o ubiquinol oxidase subunit 2 [Devosia crocina]